MRTLELLSPALNVDTAIIAINAGADAVYIGGPSHGARAAAGNSIKDIKQLCEYAHRYRARVYVTLNTLIYENELTHVQHLVHDLYHAGVDALIIQDLALTLMDIPPIALHASTQCDIRTVEKARLLADAGMSQLVLPREFTLQQIKEIHTALPETPLEVFVHGALCVSYSGDCRASLVCGGRSANRGECAQICRLPYRLTDRDGRQIGRDRHFLSMRDLNRLDRLEDLARAGVSSFKIEGRLKDPGYVRTVTAVYSRTLDAICRQHPDEFRRSSAGRVTHGFQPDLKRVFNRSFTTYMLDGNRQQPHSLASMDTPKSTGQPIGRVSSIKGRLIIVNINPGITLTNGDGITYFDNTGVLTGFRLNRVDGNKLFSTEPIDIKPGTTLYRNYDKAYDDSLSTSSDTRLLPLDMTLRIAGGRLVLDITDTERQLAVTDSIDYDYQEARSDQHATRLSTLSRLGNTIYRLNTLNDLTDNAFIPAARLTDLRRHAIETLDLTAAATHPLDLRHPTHNNIPTPETLTFHDNVSNSLSRQFYTSRGTRQITPALEVQPIPDNREIQIMSTRYCLRREIGACLLTPEGRHLHGPLFLTDTQGRLDRRFRLDFDCPHCTMHVIALPKQ